MSNGFTFRKSVCMITVFMMGLFTGCGGQGLPAAPSGPLPEAPSSVPSVSTISSASSESSETVQETSSASAQEEKQGIGAVYFLPYRQVSLLGTNALSIYAEKEGLIPGEGTLSLCRMDGTVVEEIAFADPSCVEMGVLSPREAEIVGWKGQGSKATIVLSKPILEAGDYYVAMAPDCLKSLDGTISSKAVDRGVWDFSIATFGILGGTLHNEDPKVGETRTISVAVTDEVAKCVINNYDPNQIELLVGELSQTGDLQVKFNTPGICRLDVTFLDASGETAGKINIVTEVAS